jgi:caffeoyl-CoA O-methyltransferase
MSEDVMAQDATGLLPEYAAYVEEFVEEPSPVFAELRAAIESEHRALDGQPSMQISPHQGAVLRWLVQISGATRGLEIGTFVGYSTLWIAAGLGAAGTLDTIEHFPHRAQAAADWYRRSGYPCKVNFMVGEALGLLGGLPDADYDFAFIDCDKAFYPLVIEECIRCVRPGGLIVADNAFVHGRVFEVPTPDIARGMLTYRSLVHQDPRLDTVTLPVGDGFIVSRLQSS